LSQLWEKSKGDRKNMKEPTLHSVSLEIISQQIPHSVNNHNSPSVRIGGYIPDIVVFDESTKTIKELHEVETVEIRSLPELEGTKRILWFVVRGSGWDEFRVLQFTSSDFKKATQVVAEKIHVASELSKIEREVNALKVKKQELEEKLRETQELMRQTNVVRIFAILPFIEFRDSLNEETCVICLKPSEIIFDGGEKLGKYGLCGDCFSLVLALDERRREEEEKEKEREEK